MKSLITSIFILLTSTLFGQQKEKLVQFKKADYPSSKFTIKSDTNFLGKIQIILTMTHPKNNAAPEFLCRSWLTVKKDNKVLHQKFYDIEPVGGCSGIFAPEKQPCRGYFIISKFGDYEGQTLLIDTSGKLTNLTGGSFSVSSDNKYLFTTYDSDISGLTIFDLKNRKIILSEERDDEERYSQFYFQDNSYFVTFDEEENAKEISIGVIDFNNKKIIISKKPKEYLKKSNALKIFNEVQSLQNCNCGE